MNAAKYRDSLHLRIALKRQRHIPKRKVTPDFLRRISVAILAQAAADAEVLGRATKIKLLNDPILYERVQVKYLWSRTTRFVPEEDIQKIVRWYEGQQYGLLVDFLDLHEPSVRSKFQELMYVDAGEED